MATLTVQAIVRTGLEPTLAAAAALGDAFANDGKTFLRVKNGGGSNRTVTIASTIPTAAIPQGAALSNAAVVVDAGEERWIGPFDPAYWNNSSGLVTFTYSAETDLTVGAYRL